MYDPLTNYITTHRRNAGLNQSELAALIGVDNRSSVSRYEQALRFPNLEAALALEVVFGEPVSQIFAGVTDRTRKDVRWRARVLLEGHEDPTKDDIDKFRFLAELARLDDPSIIPVWDDEV